MKTILIVAVPILLSSGCSSPLEPSQSGNDTSITITSLSPSTGPIGTHVIVRGSGFTAADNTVSFTAMQIDGETPNEPSVIAGLASADHATVDFDVLALWRPRCSYLAQGPCPFARIPTAPGTYRVTVSNASGTSNGMTFTVTR
jgi:hypothetical protein